MAQLEGSALKAHICTRADLQDKAKVNVHKPALSVYENVAIVSVLGLQQVAGNGIPAPQTPLFWVMQNIRQGLVISLILQLSDTQQLSKLTCQGAAVEVPSIVNNDTDRCRHA